MELSTCASGCVRFADITPMTPAGACGSDPIVLFFPNYLPFFLALRRCFPNFP